jgi:hypothetical protein
LPVHIAHGFERVRELERGGRIEQRQRHRDDAAVHADFHQPPRAIAGAREAVRAHEAIVVLDAQAVVAELALVDRFRLVGHFAVGRFVGERDLVLVDRFLGLAPEAHEQLDALHHGPAVHGRVQLHVLRVRDRRAALELELLEAAVQQHGELLDVLRHGPQLEQARAFDGRAKARAVLVPAVLVVHDLEHAVADDAADEIRVLRDQRFDARQRLVLVRHHAHDVHPAGRNGVGVSAVVDAAIALHHGQIPRGAPLHNDVHQVHRIGDVSAVSALQLDADRRVEP